MLKTRFPIWYPFQEIKSINFKITLKDLEELLKERLEIYQSGDFNYSKLSTESEQDYSERMTRERKSYAILKMGVANDELENGYLGNWFVEQEGDLFEKRFKDIKWQTKLPILNHLFPVDEFGRNWMEIDQLSTYLDEDLYSTLNIESENHMIRKFTKGKYNSGTTSDQGLHKILGVNFRYAPFLVRTRKSRLHKGWVIDSLDRLSSTVKKRFESVLRQELRQYAERIKTEAPGHIKRLTGEIRGILTQLIPRNTNFDFSSFEFEGSYEDNLLLFPPCVQDLMLEMKSTGYLKHHNRFQLGLFLKHTGMDVDEQMQYWYNLAVDNLNISYEKFEKNVGYTIRHLYGLEGRKVDYEMMSCGTIQSTANYHCRFQDMKLETIQEIGSEYIKSFSGFKQLKKAKMFKDELTPLIEKGMPSHACAKNLQITVGAIQERINHPLHYLEMAIKASPSPQKSKKEEVSDTDLKETDEKGFDSGDETNTIKEETT